MAYSLACGDVVPGCQARFTADTQDALMAQVGEHARDEHGLEELDAETRSAVEAAVQVD